MYRKILMLIACVLLCSLSHAQNKSAELSEYFYPFMEFEYTITPNIKNPLTRSSYKINRQGNVLTKKTYYMEGIYSRPLSETSYELEFDEENNAIVSNKQVTINALTRTPRRTNDFIVMLVIPDEGYVSTWEETVSDETYKCSAEYTYIKCDNAIKKVIRMMRVTEVDKKKITKWEYWTKSHSRIATYEKWGDGKTSLTEISDLVDAPYDIQELTKEEYTKLKLESFQKELTEKPTVLEQGSSTYKTIKQKIDESIKSDYQNNYLAKEISISVSISIDSKVVVKVSSDSDKAISVVESSTTDIINALLENSTIRQEKVIEPTTQIALKKPIVGSFNYSFTQKRMPVSLAFKKGEWKCQNEESIPEDIWNAAVRIASDKLKEDPKAKKQNLNIFYMESSLGRYIL